MTLSELPPLREALEDHGLAAKKSFGQHFLLDLNVTAKIVRLAALDDDSHVIEIGPGPGGLTRALLAAGMRVTAIEKDERFLPLLQELADAADGRLTIVHADALDANERAIAAGEPAAIVANLPNNVGTPLLLKWLTGPFRPSSMTLMFQKEVAQRIVAAPGSDAYGRLGVITGATSSARIVMDLPARAFTPPPKVASAVVHLQPLAGRPPPELLASLERLTAAAFGQRRKMLRSSLKHLGGEALCAAVGIDPARRAETLSVAEFLALAGAILAS